MENAILEFIKLGSVGLLSGVFSAFIALKIYKNQRWWDIRVEAYKGAIEHMSDLTAIYEARYRNWEASPIEPAEIAKEINELSYKVRKLRDMGAFLFSSGAEDTLSEFVSFKVNYSDVIDPGDIYGPYSVAAKTCLDSLVRYSKVDLELGRDLF